MARKLYYKVFDNGANQIDDAEWDDVLRLQHWYNSEFVWTAGKLSFKMFVVFPNPEFEPDEERLLRNVIAKRTELKGEGHHENEIIRRMLEEGLIIARRGGYFDDCIASGFTRVAGNEWNALLVVEFLLKASFHVHRCTIDVFDDGRFIKPRHIRLRGGEVVLLREHKGQTSYYERLLEHRRVFSVVDPGKYDNHPSFQNTVPGFTAMDRDERKSIAKDFQWLGFDDNFDINGDDVQGVDLNKKVASFILEDL
jgi:hypothetical protein